MTLSVNVYTCIIDRLGGVAIHTPTIPSGSTNPGQQQWAQVPGAGGLYMVVTKRMVFCAYIE